MQNKPKNVLFLLPYPLHKAPSQRFRVENLLFLLDENKISYRLAPFMDLNVWDILYKKGNILSKTWSILKSYLKRAWTVLVVAPQYSYILIHREAAPIGPPIFEWYLKKVLKKKIIFDFDDAIWIPNTSQENSIAALVKSFWKIKYICAWSYKIAAGNHFLGTFAQQSGAQSIHFIPTVVNTENRYQQLKKTKQNDLVVGWTGSHSTLKFLDAILPIIEQLQEEIDFTFLVIADKQPDFKLKKWEFVAWNEQREIEDLLKIDIGIMPLVDDAWSEGKCGFKLIQYLSLGIPAIANPVGVNKDIIEHGINGYLVQENEDWKKYLRILLEDENLRAQYGIKGRAKMVAQYSTSAIKDRYLSLFQ